LEKVIIMKNIVLTTLFAGCFAVSSAVAEGGAFKAGTFDFGAKLAAGMSFGKFKEDDSDISIKKNAGLFGIALTTRYNVTDCFGIGGELFGDFAKFKKTFANNNNAYKLTFELKNRSGFLFTLYYSPTESMSFLFGVGVVKNGKLKITEETSNGTTTVSKSGEETLKIAPIFKLGADYHFNKNWSLGVEGTYSQAKFKDAEDLKFRNATIAATVKYTF